MGKLMLHIIITLLISNAWADIALSNRSSQKATFTIEDGGLKSRAVEVASGQLRSVDTSSRFNVSVKPLNAPTGPSLEIVGCPEQIRALYENETMPGAELRLLAVDPVQAFCQKLQFVNQTGVPLRFTVTSPAFNAEVVAPAKGTAALQVSGALKIRSNLTGDAVLTLPPGDENVQVNLDCSDGQKCRLSQE